MIPALQVVTAASGYPITVQDAKRQLRITHSYEDAHIQELIAAATSWAQNETRRHFLTATVRLSFDRFPIRRCSVSFKGRFDSLTMHEVSKSASARNGAIFLPGGKVTAINDVKYDDEDDVEQTLTGPTSSPAGTDYQEDITDDDEAFVMPKVDEDWPSTLGGKVNAVRIEYDVGFGSKATDVPGDIRQAIRFRVADMFVNRTDSNVATTAAENLLAPWRVMVF